VFVALQDIVIASGCSGAIDIALTGLLNPGDNILLPKPAFPLYQVICDAHKIQVKFYNLLPEKNWEADLAHLESLVDENTKAILVNNPSNPCGSVYSKEHLQQILAVADHHKLPVIADEIYGDMVFGNNMFFPMATLTKTVPVISVGGLAKKFLIPGWRVGWLMVHDRNNTLKDVRTAYFKLSQLILGASSLVMVRPPVCGWMSSNVLVLTCHSSLCRARFRTFSHRHRAVPKRRRSKSSSLTTTTRSSGTRSLRPTP
jgi:tyrosine aminotransferase